MSVPAAAAGVGSAALGVGLAAHLGATGGDAASPYHLAARSGLVALVLRAATASLRPRPGPGGRLALAGGVVLVLAWPVGLLADPATFVGAGATSPETVGDARLVGAALAGALLLLAAWLARRWWTWRRSTRRSPSDTPRERTSQ